MPDVLTIFLSVLFFCLLGGTFVKGCDFVRQKNSQYLPHFYLVSAVIRILLIQTVIGLYALFSNNKEDALHFTAMFLIMYAVSMAVALVLIIRKTN